MTANYWGVCFESRNVIFLKDEYLPDTPITKPFPPASCERSQPTGNSGSLFSFWVHQRLQVPGGPTQCRHRGIVPPASRRWGERSQSQSESALRMSAADSKAGMRSIPLASVGIPNKIISDCGVQSTSAYWRKQREIFAIQNQTMPAYQPEGNGIVEHWQDPQVVLHQHLQRQRQLDQ